jgi:hypothetical protein
MASLIMFFLEKFGRKAMLEIFATTNPPRAWSSLRSKMRIGLGA